MRGVGVLDVAEVYRPDPELCEPRPFLDRVLEVVRLFEDGQVVRLRVMGTIAAGEPIEALEEPEAVEVRGPLRLAWGHRAALRRYLCPALDRASSDAFEIARVITPLLAGLKAAGSVPLDLDPWLFAGVALLIARTGVAAFCAEEQEDGGAMDAEGGDGSVESKGGAGVSEEAADRGKETPALAKEEQRRNGRVARAPRDRNVGDNSPRPKETRSF